MGGSRGVPFQGINSLLYHVSNTHLFHFHRVHTKIVVNLEMSPRFDEMILIMKYLKGESPLYSNDIIIEQQE